MLMWMWMLMLMLMLMFDIDVDVDVDVDDVDVDVDVDIDVDVDVDVDADADVDVDVDVDVDIDVDVDVGVDVDVDVDVDADVDVDVDVDVDACMSSLHWSVSTSGCSHPDCVFPLGCLFSFRLSGSISSMCPLTARVVCVLISFAFLALVARSTLPVCLHFAMRAPHRITNPRRLHAGYGSASPILGASEHATRQRITNPRATSRKNLLETSTVQNSRVSNLRKQQRTEVNTTATEEEAENNSTPQHAGTKGRRRLRLGPTIKQPVQPQRRFRFRQTIQQPNSSTPQQARTKGRRQLRLGPTIKQPTQPQKRLRFRQTTQQTQTTSANKRAK
jgi:hypothetical protein